MEIKDYIRIKRLQAGKTLDDVAREVGVSEATVSRWESGEIANMRRDKIILLSKSLGISPLDILDLRRDDPTEEKEVNRDGLVDLYSFTENVRGLMEFAMTLSDPEAKIVWDIARAALQR